ncbi:MAG: hypothetical protein SV760_09075 [Halobacteria archaeon]|nr:hypothetical protein [Halobacteria archaeon]
MLDSLLDIFRTRTLETSYDSAAEDFKEEMEDEIQKAREESDRVVSELKDAVDGLDDKLAEMEGESYDEDVVEDVMTNIVMKHRRAVERLEISDDPVDIYREMEEFIEDFQDMSKKEQAVMRQAGLPDDFYEKLEGVEESYEELGRLLESEYSTLERYRDLDEAVSERRRNLDKLEELREERDDLGIDEIKERRDELDAEFEDLKTSEVWEEYQSLKGELQEAKKEREDQIREVSQAISKTERGLKKILYESKNGDLSIGVDTRVLEEVRDSEAEEILRAEAEEVEEAATSLRNELPENTVEGKDREKLLNGLGTLEDASEYSERIDSLEDEIESLEDRIEDHEAATRKKEIESEKESLERSLEEKDEKRDELRKRIDKREQEVEELEEEIRRLLDESEIDEVKLTDEP